MKQQDNKYITRDMIHKDSIEGNYFADGNAVKLDYQNGTIETVLFCDEKEFAEHAADALNILYNLNNDGIELKNKAGKK
jgi:hypothetical protein